MLFRSKEVAGWIFPQAENLGTDLSKLRVNIEQIEKETGLKFPLPEKSIELAKGKEWNVNFGALTQSKRKQCGEKSSD